METQGKTVRNTIAVAVLATAGAFGVFGLGDVLDSDAGRAAAGGNSPVTASAESPSAASEGSARVPSAAESAPDAAATANPAGRTDREILRAKLVFAESAGLDTSAIGGIVAAIGRSFVGTPYVPHVLDAAGPERLIVNLRELDCVTFVENALAISRVFLSDEDSGERDFAAFRDELRRIRYRGGVIDGYPSRLHYFSEWIRDNERKGIVRNVTREIGGVPLPGQIRFMSSHREAYPQLADEENLAAIRDIERRLNSFERFYIPEDRIEDIAHRIRSGDIIAATSTVDGLDVAHTGIALWVDGELHLLHAPLVGESVQISERTLAERVKRIDGQDGIMVARPRA